MIRTATEDDIPRILEIENEAISPPWTHGGLLGEIYNEDSFFALAIDAEDATLGFVILRRMGDEGELFQIAVEKAHRQRGIADTLMEAAIDWAHGNGLGSIYLEVRESNEAAIALYKKHGFIQTGRRKGYYTEPMEDAAVMKFETLANREDIAMLPRLPDF